MANKVFLTGRLTKDPESRIYGDDNKTMVLFTIAVSRHYKKGANTADFINCTSFGTPANFLEKYGKKGMNILVEGELQSNNYTDKSGNKHYGLNVVVNSVESLSTKAEMEGKSAKADAEPESQVELPFS